MKHALPQLPHPTPPSLTTAAAEQWSVADSVGKRDSCSEKGRQKGNVGGRNTIYNTQTLNMSFLKITLLFYSNSPQCSNDSLFLPLNNDLRCLQICYILYFSTFLGNCITRNKPLKTHGATMWHHSCKWYRASIRKCCTDTFIIVEEWFLSLNSWGDRLKLQIN